MKQQDAPAIRSRSDLTIYRPEEAKSTIAKADAMADYATKLRDWPLLEKAIDAKLDEQQDFVEWWRLRVRRTGRYLIVADRGQLTVDAAEQLTDITKQQVSRWATWLKRRDETRSQLILSAMKHQFAESARGVVETLNTGDMEGYTPQREIDAARGALGSIDVDPASCAQAQQTVKAKIYYTLQTDGLAREWSGNVFLNPPYNAGLIDKFIAKLLAEIASGRTRAAILLTNNNTDTRWFHEAGTIANAICLTRGRVKFYKPDSFHHFADQWASIFLFGEQLDRFVHFFAPIGLCLQRI